MDVSEISIQVPECPEASDKLEAQIRQAVDELIGFVRSDSGSLRLMDFERSLWSQMAVLFRLCVAMFLALRHERLNLSGYEADGWRVKKELATRTVKTICGVWCLLLTERRNTSSLSPRAASGTVAPAAAASTSSATMCSVPSRPTTLNSVSRFSPKKVHAIFASVILCPADARIGNSTRPRPRTGSE